MNVKSFRPSETFFFLHGLYKTHSCSLSYLMDCGIVKTPWNICSAFSIFLSQSSNSTVCFTLSVTVWRQCLLPHTELISIDAISSVRIKSLIFSPALGWCRSRGWMSAKAINHRHGVALLENLLKSFLTHMLYPKTMSGASTGMALNPPAGVHPCVAPKTVHATSSFQTWRWWWSQSWDAAMELTELSTKGTPRRCCWLSWQPQPCSHLQHSAES